VSHVSITISERLQIKIGGKNFVCSHSHKFYDNGAWIEATGLKTGCKIDGLLVSEISDYEYGEVVKITVDDAHTYVCEGLLSHNKQGTTPAP
jgi:hypothetical protein